MQSTQSCNKVYKEWKQEVVRIEAKLVFQSGV